MPRKATVHTLYGTITFCDHQFIDWLEFIATGENATKDLRITSDEIEALNISTFPPPNASREILNKWRRSHTHDAGNYACDVCGFVSIQHDPPIQTPIGRDATPDVDVLVERTKKRLKKRYMRIKKAFATG